MPHEHKDLWELLRQEGEDIVTEADYEHRYQREIRHDLRQYIWFRVGQENYALALRDVAEIRKVFSTTPVPRTAGFLVGVGNVRGRIVPVIDLAKRLGLGEVNKQRSTRILIVEMEDEHYGLLVDEVLDVIRIPPEWMEEKPEGINDTNFEYIHCLAHVQQHLIIVLDLHPLLRIHDFIPSRFRQKTHQV